MNINVEKVLTGLAVIAGLTATGLLIREQTIRTCSDEEEKKEPEKPKKVTQLYISVKHGDVKLTEVTWNNDNTLSKQWFNEEFDCDDYSGFIAPLVRDGKLSCRKAETIAARLTASRKNNINSVDSKIPLDLIICDFSGKIQKFSLIEEQEKENAD